MTDLIKQVGGLQKAKDIVNGAPQWAIWWCAENKKYLDFIPCSKCLHVVDIRQSIADYNTDHCSDIGNHISPSTRVINK